MLVHSLNYKQVVTVAIYLLSIIYQRVEDANLICSSIIICLHNIFILDVLQKAVLEKVLYTHTHEN